jgi:hypothetical protein
MYIFHTYQKVLNLKYFDQIKNNQLQLQWNWGNLCLARLFIK